MTWLWTKSLEYPSEGGLSLRFESMAPSRCQVPQTELFTAWCLKL